MVTRKPLKWIALVILLSLSGCGEKEKIVPIAFTKLNITYQSSEWEWQEFHSDTIIEINDNDKLCKYLRNADKQYIDFNANTLLLVHGKTPNEIDKITTSITYCNNVYTLNVNTIQTFITKPDAFVVCYKISKVKIDSQYKLIINKMRNILLIITFMSIVFNGYSQAYYYYKNTRLACLRMITSKCLSLFITVPLCSILFI